MLAIILQTLIGLLLLQLPQQTCAFASSSTTAILRPYAAPPPRGVNNWRTSDRHNSLFASTAQGDDAPAPVSMTYNIVTIIGKTASSVVSISFFLLLAYTRDALLLTLFAGSIANAVSSKVLKKILNHERPSTLQTNDKIKLKPSDGGMPSSHAMSLGFIGTVITMGVVPSEYQIIVGLILAVYSAIALRYRVRDDLHTVQQVAAGLALGISNAILWQKFAIGGDRDGSILTYVQQNFVSSETGLFPYTALAVPVIVGALVVGSFERRIAVWLKKKKEE